MGPGPNNIGPRPYIIGPGPNIIGPRPYNIGPRPNMIGSGPYNIGPGPNIIGPGPKNIGPGPINIPRSGIGSGIGIGRSEIGIDLADRYIIATSYKVI